MGYVEALLGTLAVMGGMLLLLGWAWNPRPGFGGVGIFFSRYLLTVGLPFEVVASSDQRSPRVLAPAPFWIVPWRRCASCPGSRAVEWHAGDDVGRFGARGAFEQEFEILSLRWCHLRVIA